MVKVEAPTHPKLRWVHIFFIFLFLHILILSHVFFIPFSKILVLSCASRILIKRVI
jgi:hypothetical protein